MNVFSGFDRLSPCRAFPAFCTARSGRGYAVLAATALLAGLAAAGALRLRFNLTSSLPIGLYRITNDAPTLERGAIVLYCLPSSIARFAHERSYVPKGGRCADGLVPVGKIAAALPGDTVGVTADGITVNGTPQLHSRPLKADMLGRQLPRLVGGSYVVRRGYIWLLAPADRSFDSRYLGPLTTVNVVARIYPIWTLASRGVR